MKPYHKGKDNPQYGKRGPLSPNYGRKHSPETREKIRLTKLVENNPMWKGDDVQVIALHGWLRSRLKKPQFCEHCKEKPPVDLANINGKYSRDLNDYVYLCRSCHMKYDYKVGVRVHWTKKEHQK